MSTSATVSIQKDQKVLHSDIPARLDHLPWSRFHWLLAIALGITWVLDGLQVTVVGSIGPMLKRPKTLGLTEGETGLAGSVYLAGAVIGALIETDRRGELAIGYLIGAGLMLVAAAGEWFLGVDSERKALEEVASPLSAEA